MPHLAGAPTPTTACGSAIAAAYGGFGAGYRADQIAAAYGFDPLYAEGDYGAGKTIALIEFSGYLPSDIATYASCYGVSPAIAAIPVDGGPTVQEPSDVAEAELDIEDVIGLAPGAGVLVYEGPSTGASASNNSAYDVYAAAIDQDAAQVISTSWGSCEAYTAPTEMKMENLLFEQAALQGQTVVSAAGDEGSAKIVPVTARAPAASALAVDDPASQPFVTGVGGTTLTISPSRSEVAWNTNSPIDIGGAGGGGVSALWPIPAYQLDTPASLAVVNASTHGSCHSTSGCREVPDLAANAGAPYATYCTLGASLCDRGGWTGVGGTSASAPTVAALVALADASPVCAANGNAGFLNPVLYLAASGSAYPTTFFDVTSGNNDLTGTHSGLYPAGVGYDLRHRTRLAERRKR